MRQVSFQLALPKQQSAVAPEGVRTNRDMDPTPEGDRTWDAWAWLSFWFSATCDPAYWSVASSLIGLGLDWRTSIGIIVFGNFLIATVITLNGLIGARLRVPFPVIVRASFGFHFAWFPIVSRIILALFWNGIETLNGAYGVHGMLDAIFTTFKNIPNDIPQSQGITSSEMLSFLIYWLIQLPFLFIPPRQLRWLFTFKACLVPAVALATLGYMVSKGGSGPLVSSTEEVSGRTYSQAWLLGLAAVMGNWATLALNMPDFTRYSTATGSQWWQMLAIPLWGTAISICAIFSASASISLYGGEAMWNVFDLIAQWDSRAARFFACFAWTIACIAANITANTLSAGNDLTTLFPKYINITRGQIICALIGGWCMVPWKILASAIAFLNFMSAYAVVVAPMAGVLTVDYFLVKKGRYDVPGLYDPHGRYLFWRGINWRAAATMLLVVPFFIPGMVQSINSDIQVGGIFWLYAPGFLAPYVIGAGLYWGLNLLKPDRASVLDESEMDGFYTVPHDGNGTGAPAKARSDKSDRSEFSSV